jgi:acyl-CoA dehydrogenase
MLVLGGSLKRREKISARLGDVLSQLYLCSATLKRFEDDGRPEADLPLLHWSMQDALHRMQTALDGVLKNFPSRLAALLLRVLIFPLGRCLAPPSDELGHQVAALLLQPGPARDRLTVGMYVPKAHSKDRHASFPLLNPLDETTSHSTRLQITAAKSLVIPQAGEEANESLGEPCVYDENDAVGALEAALLSTLACEPLQAKVEAAHKAGQVKALDELARIAEARDSGVINAEEALLLERDYALRRKVVMVDDFAPAQLRASA